MISGGTWNGVKNRLTRKLRQPAGLKTYFAARGHSVGALSRCLRASANTVSAIRLRVSAGRPLATRMVTLMNPLAGSLSAMRY